MTHKYIVGDKVEFTEDFGRYKKGDVVEITGFENVDKDWYRIEGYNGKGDVFGKRIKLAKLNPTENQRITALEETVAKQGEEINELKLIVEQIRKPSTVIEEALANDIIEFEGKQYKKVDREAREGDVVVFHNNQESLTNRVTSNKPYPTKYIEEWESLRFPNDDYEKTKNMGNYYEVYKSSVGRTLETVDVYELIVEDKQDIEPPAPKNQNELRAEIIEKAKGFVDYTATDDTHFEINGNQVLAWRIIRKGKGYDALTGVAVCSPKDVFNEDIGKAIAVGRLEGLDVSEFERAVQPTVPVVGTIVNYHSEKRIAEVMPEYSKMIDIDTQTYLSTALSEPLDTTIINDTNAQYLSEVNE